MDLINAVGQDKDQNVLYLLSKYPSSINFQNKKGRTALMVAVGRYVSSVEITKILLNHVGINLYILDNHNNNALHHALRPTRNTSRQLEICRILINTNININQLNDDGRTPLMLGIKISLNIVKLLLSRKDINVNMKDGCGRTALMHAVYVSMQDRVAICQELISAGCDVNAKDLDGNDVLLHSLKHDRLNYDLLETWLRAGADPYTINNFSFGVSLFMNSYWPTGTHKAIINKYRIKKLISTLVFITNNYFAIIPRDVRTYIELFY